MLGNRQDAEDVTQEAFLRAFRAIQTFDPDRPFDPWLKKITLNLCLNYLERKTDIPLDPDQMPMERDPANPLEARIEARDQSAQIRAELLKLPPRYRAAIELRHFQELSYAEMAEALDCPLNQVKSDLFRARRLLVMHMRSHLRP
jgi:RNA polymerase sigma factor (sigma-70 family)